MKQLLFASLQTRLMLLVLLALLPILDLALYDRIVYAEIDRLAARDLGVLGVGRWIRACRRVSVGGLVHL